jgi:hypothetical protein
VLSAVEMNGKQTALITLLNSHDRSYVTKLVSRGPDTDANTSNSFRSPTNRSSFSCLGSCSRSKGKGRNAWYGLIRLFLSTSAKSCSHPRLPHPHSAISSTLTSEGFTMVPDTRMSPLLDDNDGALKRVFFYFCIRFSMKPTRIRMCHSLVMNYGLYKRMEIFVSEREQ